MKPKRFCFASILIASLLTLAACGGGGASTGAGTVAPTPRAATVDSMTAVETTAASGSAATLDETEAANLLRMREEEKLARDVYTLLLSQWGQTIFDNIAQSEQQHMDAVLTLLVRYGLPDPAAGNAVGVFTDPHVQDLFNALLEKGQTSLVAALTVGATIEDMDIRDLQERIAQTDNPDIQLVYSDLMQGSRNHLRAFISQLTGMGVTYTPQYISQDEFDAIVSSPMETGTS